MRFIDQLVKRWKTLDESWRFAISAFLVARLFYSLWSWIIFTSQPLAVQNINLWGEPVLTIFNLKTSEAYTYLREINGQSLTFRDRKSTRLNSSHLVISYAVFCLNKKKKTVTIILTILL